MKPGSDVDDDATDSWSTTALARRLGVSTPTIQRWVDAGVLRAWKTPGGHRRVDGDSARALLRARRLPDGAAPVQVVVVDDNPADRELLEAVVREALPGVGLAGFDNAVQALVAIGQHAPAIVITDIVMPHMDGLEMIHQLARLRAAKPKLLVAVSATLLRGAARERGLPRDAVFLTKPVDTAAMIALLRNHRPASPGRKRQPGP